VQRVSTTTLRLQSFKLNKKQRLTAIANVNKTAIFHIYLTPNLMLTSAIYLTCKLLAIIAKRRRKQTFKQAVRAFLGVKTVFEFVCTK